MLLCKFKGGGVCRARVGQWVQKSTGLHISSTVVHVSAGIVARAQVYI